MRYEEIEKIIQEKKSAAPIAQITFKTRSPIKGMFLKTNDYHELSRKNLWRIVSESYIESYNQSKDENLARIFNGTEFTKLKLVP